MAHAVESSHDVDLATVTVVQVAVGESHTLALTASGSVYTWGRGQFGRQGMGVFQDELEPTLMEIGMSVEPDDSDSPETRASSDWDLADRSRITQIAAGSYHSLALSGDGTVWSWGFNAYGQLGRQRAASYPAPITFPAKSGFSFEESRRSEGSQLRLAMVEAGGMMSSAIDSEGGLWLWGAVPQPAADAQTSSNSFEVANIEKPQRVLALTGHNVRRVSCGSEHILALVDGRSGMQIYAWGGNAYGQLGLGDFNSRDTPSLVTAMGSQQVGMIIDFACGFFHSVVVTAEDDFGDAGNNMNHTASVMDQVMASPKLRGRVIPEQYMDGSMSSPRVRSKQGYPYSVSNNMLSRNQQRSSYSVASDGSSRAHSVSSVSSWGGPPLRAQAQASKQREVQSAGSRLSTCWSFGQNENGQLGIGSRSNSHTPGVIDSLPTHERIQAVSCGLFHTAVVMESGDVWVWGMEGGLGQCPGIGPPGSKSGDAVTPVRVFGESSAKCNPLSGAKGIACGGAHTVTVANGGADLWAWGRGKNGVLGLGHHSDSWFPSPVLWPPGIPKESDPNREYDDRKSSSRASSRGGSRGRGDEIRPYVADESAKAPGRNSFSRSVAVEQLQLETTERPPRGQVASIRKAMEPAGQPCRPGTISPGRPSRPGTISPGRPSRPGTISPGRPSRRGDQFWPPVQADPQEHANPRSFRREMGIEPSTATMNPSMRAFKYQVGNAPAAPSPDHHPDDVTALKAELTECRRYAENLHAAVYGGLETFALPLPADPNYFAANGSNPKTSPLQEWQQRVEEAPLEELAKLDLFYKGMRNRLKDMLFQRKMEDWCRRAMSGVSASSYKEPPPVREPYSVQNTPFFDEPGDLALRVSSILSDRGEMLPPAALVASIAEFRMQSQRHRR